MKFLKISKNGDYKCICIKYVDCYGLWWLNLNVYKDFVFFFEVLFFVALLNNYMNVLVIGYFFFFE